MKIILVGVFAMALMFGLFGETVGLTTNSSAQADTGKQRAVSQCRKKFGKRFVRVGRGSNGQFICYHRKPGRRGPGPKATWAEVLELCRKAYPFAQNINVTKRKGKWGCTWSE